MMLKTKIVFRDSRISLIQLYQKLPQPFSAKYFSKNCIIESTALTFSYVKGRNYRIYCVRHIFTCLWKREKQQTCNSNLVNIFTWIGSRTWGKIYLVKAESVTINS